MSETWFKTANQLTYNLFIRIGNVYDNSNIIKLNHVLHHALVVGFTIFFIQRFIPLSYIFKSDKL